MNQHLWRYIENEEICGGPKALPTHWRDKGDISNWTRAEVATEGWVPNMVDDQRVPGETDADWDDVISTDEGGRIVVQTLRSRPLPPADREDLAAQIDAAVAAVYGRFTRFQVEYEAREAQALAYKQAGYAGAVPTQVAAFATPAGVSAQQATDLILAQAAQLRGALDQLGVLRMRKYEVLRAATDMEARAAFHAVADTVSAIDRALV